MNEKMLPRNYQGPELQIVPAVPEKNPRETNLPDGIGIEDITKILEIHNGEDGESEEEEKPPTVH